jgi:hypothetical protein
VQRSQEADALSLASGAGEPMGSALAVGGGREPCGVEGTVAVDVAVDGDAVESEPALVLGVSAAGAGWFVTATRGPSFSRASAHAETCVRRRLTQSVGDAQLGSGHSGCPLATSSDGTMSSGLGYARATLRKRPLGGFSM